MFSDVLSCDPLCVLFESIDFNDPKLFDDPQLFDDQLEVWTLIIQKSTVIPPSLRDDGLV